MKPLPLAPRPFTDEALGSWIGRLASRYRIGVLQLDAQYRLQLGLSRPLAWLAPGPMSEDTLERLCWLTHCPALVISALAVEGAAIKVRSVSYCWRCVFLNPLEVESPYWKREWRLPGASLCAIHGEYLAALPAGKVRASANMRELIRAVGKYERARKERDLKRHWH